MYMIITHMSYIFNIKTTPTSAITHFRYILYNEAKGDIHGHERHLQKTEKTDETARMDAVPAGGGIRPCIQQRQ